MMLHRHVRHVVAHPETRRFGKFAIVGILNTSIDFLVFFVLVHFAAVPYLWANFFSYCVATINSYYLNRRWTFRSSVGNWQREFGQYFLVITIGFLLNEGLLYILVDHAGLPTVLSKIGVIGVVMIWNYGANRFWTFRNVVKN